MSGPRLRMLAGPNGSGKTSLLGSLRDNYAVPLGFDLNPDEVELALATTGRFSFSRWGVAADLDEVRRFCHDHPMGGQLAIDDLRIADGELVLPAAGPTGYLAAVLSDFLPPQVGGERAVLHLRDGDVQR